MRRRIVLSLILIIPLLFGAVAESLAEEPLPDPQDEAAALHIISQLQCLVCEGQPLAQSEAPLALDLRRAIRRKVAEGRSETEIIASITRQYGRAILLSPPLTYATLALWIAPALILALGLAILSRFLLRHKALSDKDSAASPKNIPPERQ